jgi:phage recombination protein Bet
METKSLTRTTAAQVTAPTKPRALEIMASRLSVEPGKMLSTLKATVFSTARNEEELMMLVVVANEYGLNPFLKEIHAFPAKGGGICPVVGVDGWIKMLNRHKDFDGIEFEFQESEDDASSPPVYCEATIHLKNRARPVKVKEYFNECYRKTDPWDKSPRRMLRHKALIQASRVAFGFSGVHDEDEAIDITATITTEPQKQIRAPKGEEHQERKPTADARPIREQFQALLDENEIPFNIFKIWAEDTGNVADADSLASLDEVKEADLERLLRSRAGLITGLKETKAAAAR